MDDLTISRGSATWNYLSDQQRVLLEDGQFLWRDSERHKDEEPTDYSYLVFPFAKMYEGFLKQLFLDLGIIEPDDYASTHFRIGRALSPTLVDHLGKHSVYGQLCHKYAEALAIELWQAWKEGRNMVFHYFPHNYRALSRIQAGEAIRLILTAMNDAVERTNVHKGKVKVDAISYTG
jgi:hypothetical protein